MTDIANRLRNLADQTYAGILDHVTGSDHTSALIVEGNTLRIREVYPEGESHTYDVFTAPLGDEEQVKAILDRWWNRRGRMEFASNYESMPPLIEVWSDMQSHSDYNVEEVYPTIGGGFCAGCENEVANVGHDEDCPYDSTGKPHD